MIKRNLTVQRLPRETLERQLDAAYLALESLGKERARLDEWKNTTQVELSNAAAERDQNTSTLNELRTQLAQTTAERDQLRTQLAQVATERQNALTQIDRLLAQIDRIYGSFSWRLANHIVKQANHVRRLLRWVLRVALWLPGRVVDLLIHTAAIWRAVFSTPRTLWGVTPILTLPLLARCDRLLGLKSDSVVFTTYYTARKFDINLERICGSFENFAPRLFALTHDLLLRFVLIRYDAFHLFCDRGILLPSRRMEINPRELAKYAAYGKRLYTHTYGADVRTREATLALGRFNICAECPEPGRFCVCSDAEGRRNIETISTYAAAMVAMGDMLAYIPNGRNIHFWPIDCGCFKVVGVSPREKRPLRIAHAPNHPHFKGTRFLEAAVARLNAEGHAIEIIRVQGVPNERVIELFSSADLVADQFISGFYGYTALEAMGLGKPVLCYLRGPEMIVNPEECPIVNVNPDTLYNVLKSCVDGSLDLGDIGQRSRWYVERYHSIEAVAVRLGGLYLETGNFPERVNKAIRERIRVLETKLTALSPPTTASKACGARPAA